MGDSPQKPLLEVDGVTGQAFLIPFKGRAQLVIGYKGFNTLAARSGLTVTGAGGSRVTLTARQAEPAKT